VRSRAFTEREEGGFWRKGQDKGGYKEARGRDRDTDRLRCLGAHAETEAEAISSNCPWDYP
jgi:hypothetical protein